MDVAAHAVEPVALEGGSVSSPVGIATLNAEVRVSSWLTRTLWSVSSLLRNSTGKPVRTSSSSGPNVSPA